MQVNIIVTIVEGSEFDYLRPKGRIIFKIDSAYDVPQLDIFLVIGTLTVLGFGRKARKHFLRIERTPPDTPPIVSDDSNFSLDTVH